MMLKREGNFCFFTTKNNKRAQLTIFIIIAIVIIGGITSYFAFRNSAWLGKGVPATFEPAYTSFLSCLEEDTLTGLNIMGSQGGYISLPELEPGSSYMPFSSQLDFLGTSIPYWYYVSGNNIQKEQVPLKSEMENQLAEFINSRIRDCSLENYYKQGYEIRFGEPSAKTTINDKSVSVNLDMDIIFAKENESAVITSHNVEVKSMFGTLYNSAKKIYEHEQESLFLENYGVDILRMYAPVDGVEISCSPKIWSADEIFSKLGIAIEANTQAIRLSSNSFTLGNKENKYFVVDLNTEPNVEARFLNSRNWSNSFEVSPTDGAVMVASPVGNQPGMGILGFCYVSYHFIYNMNYPVLVQLFSGEELFQFPFAVVIIGNKPRKAIESTAIDPETSELCSYQNTEISVSAYDTDLNPIEADISFECIGSKCNIGKTSLSNPLLAKFPQCVNGIVRAKAEGFEDTQYTYSVIEPGDLSLIMDRIYPKEVILKINGAEYTSGSGNALISFIPLNSTKGLRTISYPEQNKIGLSEGQYEVQAYIYKNSSITIAETKQQKCMDVPQTGIGGLFGFTQEKCLDIVIPSQVISNALSAGGKENYYIIEDELKNSKIIEINAWTLPPPVSIEQLQANYILFDNKGLDITFK